MSLLIICGGKSSRLGEDKRFIEVGGVGMLENILKKSAAENFFEIFLCVEENFSEIKNLAEKYHAKILEDEIKNCGPLYGIANGLKKIKTDWALAVSADMPFFDFKIFGEINFSKNISVIIKNQPLASFYHKNCEKIFFQEILSGRLKISDAIKKIPHKIIEIESEKFFNVNTQADLKLARGRAENLSRKIPVISIFADNSGTGKTTFIEKILKNLSELKIAVIKSSHHKIFSKKFCDGEKFLRAGAKKIYVGENFFDAVEKVDGVDLILTESRTKKYFPAIKLFRGEEKNIFDEKIVAIFTTEQKKSAEIYHFDLNDEKSAEKIILFLAGK